MSSNAALLSSLASQGRELLRQTPERYSLQQRLLKASRLANQELAVQCCAILISDLTLIRGQYFTPSLEYRQKTYKIGLIDTTGSYNGYKSHFELKEEIVQRVSLLMEILKKRHHFYCSPNGTVFDFGKIRVTIHSDQTFDIEGKRVLYHQMPVKITKLFATHPIRLCKLPCQRYEFICSPHQGPRYFVSQWGSFYKV